MNAAEHSAMLQQAYVAVGDPLRWDALRGQWANALEADSSLLFTPGDQFGAQPIHGHRFDFETARSYGEYYHLHDVWTQSGRSRGLFKAGQVGCGERLVAQGDLHRSAFYNDFLRRMGQEWLLCSVLFEHGNPQGLPETVLSFYRRPGRRAFGRGATAALQRALPHLQRCMMLHHELLRARTDRTLCEARLDPLGIGVVLLGADDRMQFANPQAEVWLHTSAPGASATPPVLPQLQQLNRLARQGHYTGQRFNTAQGPLYAMATPNHRFAQSTPPLAGAGGCVIWLIGPRAQQRGPLTLAASVFGLTRAEQKVLSLLMDDLAPKRIAQALGVELSTVRSQLSAILQKTGVQRQQELLRLMAAFPIG